MKLVVRTALWLLGHHPLQLPRLIIHSGAKYLGYRKGKKYQSLTREQILKCTMQPGYWKM